MRYLLILAAFAILATLALCRLPSADAAVAPTPATVPTTAPAVTQPTTAPADATTPTATNGGPTALAALTEPANEGFAPGLLLFVLALLLLCVIAVVLAAVVVLFLLAAGAVLLLLGMISSSVLVGVIRRTRGAAVRTFIVQASAVAGVPVGTSTMWLENRLFHLALSHRAILVIGGPGGLVVGAGVGFLFCLAAERTARFLLIRIQSA